MATREIPGGHMWPCWPHLRAAGLEDSPCYTKVSSRCFKYSPRGKAFHINVNTFLKGLERWCRRIYEHAVQRGRLRKPNCPWTKHFWIVLSIFSGTQWVPGLASLILILRERNCLVTDAPQFPANQKPSPSVLMTSDREKRERSRVRTSSDVRFFHKCLSASVC